MSPTFRRTTATETLPRNRRARRPAPAFPSESFTPDHGGAPTPDATDGWAWEAVRHPTIRNVAIAVVAAVLVGAIAIAAVLARPASYYSQATLLIDNPTQLAASADEGTIAKFSGLRAKYAALVDTPAIAAPVAKRLNIPIDKVYDATNTFLGVQSLVLVSSATAASPRQAQRIAQAVGDELSQYVQREHVRFNVPPPQRFTITVVNDAELGEKSTPTRRQALAVGVISGGLVLVGLYVLLELVGARRQRD
jgi:capsular polysaccharide biosynthesis protein